MESSHKKLTDSITKDVVAVMRVDILLTMMSFASSKHLSSALLLLVKELIENQGDNENQLPELGSPYVLS